MTPENKPILFYDGECGLCAKSVQWCLKHDHKHVLMFAPLQGTTYRDLQHNIIQTQPTDLASAVYYEGSRLHIRSDAALRALRTLGGPWAALAALGLLVPRVLRDPVYNFIAKRRIAWFGTADSCRVPAAEERSRFLP